MAFNFANLTYTYLGAADTFFVLDYNTSDNIATVCTGSYWQGSSGCMTSLRKGDIVRVYASNGNAIGMVRDVTIGGANPNVYIDWSTLAGTWV